MRCQLAGNEVSFSDEGTKGELRECTVDGSTGNGLNVSGGASVTVEGGVVRDCAENGVVVSKAGARVTVRSLSPSLFALFSPVALPRPSCFFSPKKGDGHISWDYHITPFLVLPLPAPPIFCF